jgi:hypothetical protein
MASQAVHTHPAPLGHTTQPAVSVEHYQSDQYARGLPVRTEVRAELPPLRSIGASIQSPADTMTGVQYHHEISQPNGYRPAYPTRI